MTPDFSESGVSQAAVEQLVSLYSKAAAKLRDAVLHPPGVSPSAQLYNQARAAQQLAQIDRIVSELRTGTASWIGPNVATAVTDGVTRANRQAAAIGISPAASPLEGSFNQIDHGTIRLFAQEIAADLGKATNGLAQTATKALRQTQQTAISEADVDRILAGGVIDGTPALTIRNLRDALRAVAGETITIQGKSGPIEFDVSAYARLVVRTKTRAATVAARHQRLQQVGIDLVSITGRTSKNFCTAYLGQVFSLSGDSDQYPALSELPSGGPPFHPNCSKSTRPFVADLATPQQLDDAEGLDDGDKLLNVDAATAQRRFKDLQMYQQKRAS